MTIGCSLASPAGSCAQLLRKVYHGSDRRVVDAPGKADLAEDGIPEGDGAELEYLEQVACVASAAAAVVRQAEKVAEITETEYFQQLRNQATELRRIMDKGDDDPSLDT